jgi:dTDP-4-amino-4,6-dideoxygalactose transaminase
MARIGVWPPLSPAVYVRRAARPLAWPLDDPRCTLFARARSALVAGLAAIGLSEGDEVLMPAYNHGSEVEAVLRARLQPRFYEGNAALEPDEAELERLVGERTRALFLIHYLGFAQDSARWRRWCDGRGLLLLEDAAQAWLAARDGVAAGSQGDLAVFCLYKTIGVPDGAALVTRGGAPCPAGRAEIGAYRLARRHGAWLSRLLPWPRPGVPVAAVAAEFRIGPDAPPSAATRRVLARAVDPDAAGARRTNYQTLLDALGEHVPPPFAELPDGASPFALPVASERKGELLARLASAGVAALDFWSLAHPAIPAGEFPSAERRRATTVALPVHQSLRPRHLRLLRDAVQ